MSPHDWQRPLFKFDLFSEMGCMPATARDLLSAWEVAEYLEVWLPTLRRYVPAGKLRPSHVVGRNQMFSANELRTYKRMRK